MLISRQHLLSLTLLPSAITPHVHTQEVFAESTGQLWLDLLWCLTGTIDALTLSLQVVSVRGVAPAAAVFKPRQAIRGGGRLLELRSFNPVYEQAKVT